MKNLLTVFTLWYSTAVLVRLNFKDKEIQGQICLENGRLEKAKWNLFKAGFLPACNMLILICTVNFQSEFAEKE